MRSYLQPLSPVGQSPSSAVYITPWRKTTSMTKRLWVGDFMSSPWFVAVYKIYLCLTNIGALTDHPSAKEGNSAKWTKKGFEKKENIFIDNLLMIRNLLLLLHK